MLFKPLVGGKHAIDCDGYAYTASRLLRQAGFEVVGFANATRESDGVGHSIAALITPGKPARPIVISSYGLFGRDQPPVDPAKAKLQAKDIARREMERMLPAHAGDGPLHTFFAPDQTDAMAFDLAKDKAHEMKR